MDWSPYIGTQCNVSVYGHFVYIASPLLGLYTETPQLVRILLPDIIDSPSTETPVYTILKKHDLNKNEHLKTIFADKGISKFADQKSANCKRQLYKFLQWKDPCDDNLRSNNKLTFSQIRHLTDLHRVHRSSVTSLFAPISIDPKQIQVPGPKAKQKTGKNSIRFIIFQSHNVMEWFDFIVTENFLHLRQTENW